MKRWLIGAVILGLLAGCSAEENRWEPPGLSEAEIEKTLHAYFEQVLSREESNVQAKLKEWVHEDYFLNPQTAFHQRKALLSADSSLADASILDVDIQEILPNGDRAAVSGEIRLGSSNAASAEPRKLNWNGVFVYQGNRWIILSDSLEFGSEAWSTANANAMVEYSLDELLQRFGVVLNTAKPAARESRTLPHPSASQPAQKTGSPESKAAAPAPKSGSAKSGSATPKKAADAAGAGSEPLASSRNPSKTEKKNPQTETSPVPAVDKQPTAIIPERTEFRIHYRNREVPLTTSGALVKAIGYPDRVSFRNDQKAIVMTYPGMEALVKGQVMISVAVTGSEHIQTQEGLRVGNAVSGWVQTYGQPAEAKGTSLLYRFQNADVMVETKKDGRIGALLIVPRALAEPDPDVAFLRILNEQHGQLYSQTYQNQCASCHGLFLQGGSGPSLQKVGSKLSLDEINKILTEGIGEMPAPRLSQQEKAALALWLYLQK